MENVRVALIKQANYAHSREDAPRTMGDGFALLQSANIQCFYHMDVLGMFKIAISGNTLFCALII